MKPFAEHQTLRKRLDQAGFSKTRIVAADGGWDISSDVLKDSALAGAVDYIGYRCVLEMLHIKED